MTLLVGVLFCTAGIVGIHECFDIIMVIRITFFRFNSKVPRCTVARRWQLTSDSVRIRFEIAPLLVDDDFLQI